jgi:hypothetical protein
MAEEAHSPEHSYQPAYRSEVIEYKDRRLAVRVRGDLGSQINFQEFQHSYNPLHQSSEGIVTAASEKDYYITHDHDGNTYLVDIAETMMSGKLVSVQLPEDPAKIPPVQFGKPWDIPGMGKTAAVREVVLSKGAVAVGDAKGGQKSNRPDPFSKYKGLVLKYLPDFGR